MQFSTLELLRELIKRNSENPLHPEEEVRVFIESLLKNRFQIFLQEMEKDRINMLAIFSPFEEKPHDFRLFDDFRFLLFSGHMDTVLGYSKNQSEKAEIHDNKVFGRGACDMKGGIASFLSAVLKWIQNDHNIELLKKNKKGIAMAFTVDEERGCRGINYMDSSSFLYFFKRTDLCILAEPTECIPIIGHKGISWYTFHVKGKAAHASIPESGINAIYKAVDVINRIQTYYHELQSKNSPLGPPKLSVGTIKGGSATNIVPDSCIFTVDRRFVPGENPDEDFKKMQYLAENVSDSIQVSRSNTGWAYLLPEDLEHPWYKTIKSICQAEGIIFNKNTPHYLPAYTEADIYFRVYNIPTIILGPGSIEQAHKTPEFISLEQIEKAEGIYRKILDHFARE